MAQHLHNLGRQSQGTVVHVPDNIELGGEVTKHTNYVVEQLVADAFDAFVDVMDISCLEDTQTSCRTRLARVLRSDRCFCVYDTRLPHVTNQNQPETEVFKGPCHQMVATLGLYDLDMVVPGGRIEMAGVTAVSVRPTHRRRGPLRQMLSHGLQNARARGQTMAALWATEPTIYRRFGFGSAVKVATHQITACLEFLGPCLGDPMIVMVDRATFLDSARALYDRNLDKRPGVFRRSTDWWEARQLVASPFGSFPGACLRYALALRGEEVVGYLLFHTNSEKQDSNDGGVLFIREIFGTDVAAELELWRFAANHDLVSTLRAPFRPYPDPIIALARDSRMIKTTVSEGLHLRFLDVATALSARRYAISGKIDIALEGPDDVAGLYCIFVTSDGRAQCRRVAKQPIATDSSVRLHASTLAEVFFGGHRVSYLARAGQIEGPTDVIDRMDMMFLHRNTPVSLDIF